MKSIWKQTGENLTVHGKLKKERYVRVVGPDGSLQVAQVREEGTGGAPVVEVVLAEEDYERFLVKALLRAKTQVVSPRLIARKDVFNVRIVAAAEDRM